MYKISKRLYDLILAIVLLIIFFPIMILCALCILLCEGKPIFFKQERIGLKNHPFVIWKFRTLKMVNEQAGVSSKEDRIFPLGRILRKLKLDELPQIINVFIGNMSIVGPRPLIQSQFHHFANDVKKALYKTKPGITGVGSLYFRNEESLLDQCEGSKDDYYRHCILPEKGELEIWYYNNSTLIIDFKITVLTLFSMIFCKKNIEKEKLLNLLS